MMEVESSQRGQAIYTFSATPATSKYLHKASFLLLTKSHSILMHVQYQARSRIMIRALPEPLILSRIIVFVIPQPEIYYSLIFRPMLKIEDDCTAFKPFGFSKPSLQKAHAHSRSLRKDQDNAFSANLG